VFKIKNIKIILNTCKITIQICINENHTLLLNDKYVKIFSVMSDAGHSFLSGDVVFMQNFLIGQLTVDRSKCFVISSDHKSLTTTNCITTKFKLAKVKEHMCDLLSHGTKIS